MSWENLVIDILSWHFIDQFTNYSPQQYCHVKFLSKFFDKMVNKRDVLKIINLYLLVPTNQSEIMWNQFANKSFTWTQSNIWTWSGEVLLDVCYRPGPNQFSLKATSNITKWKWVMEVPNCNFIVWQISSQWEIVLISENEVLHRNTTKTYRQWTYCLQINTLLMGWIDSIKGYGLIQF